MEFGGEVGFIRGFLGGKSLRDKGGGSTVSESIERSRREEWEQGDSEIPCNAIKEWNTGVMYYNIECLCMV